jgi:hypothetical protein
MMVGRCLNGHVVDAACASWCDECGAAVTADGSPNLTIEVSYDEIALLIQMAERFASAWRMRYGDDGARHAVYSICDKIEEQVVGLCPNPLSVLGCITRDRANGEVFTQGLVFEDPL